MRPGPRSHRYFSLLLIALLALAGSASAVAQSGNGGRFTATPLRPQRAVSVDGSKEGARSSKAPQRPGALASVIVKLKDAPLASYTGDLAGLPATSPEIVGGRAVDNNSAASRSYLAYLDQQQRDFENNLRAAVPGARVVNRYRYTFGGVSVVAPQSLIARIAQLPGVVRVFADKLQQPTTDRSPQFIGAPRLWNQLGGQNKAGQNVIVGVIDTGIWPEHPSFADDGSYPPVPAGWSGACEPPNDGSPPIVCNRKLVGAREFLDTYKSLIGLVPGEYDSARDNEGHGTHTASTAAGNPNVQAVVLGVDRGIVSGIAPRARVAAYKALGVQGGFDSDIVAAINQAVADGVNVINFSVGGGGTDPYAEPSDLAFLDAYAAGVFVAASAGNSGPGPETVDNVGGWMTTVGASTEDRQFQSFLTLRSGADSVTLTGASITDGVPDFTPVVSPTDVLCLNPFPAGSVAGKIVACQRGSNARVEKGYNVKQGGAVGMILYNTTQTDIETDNHWLPAVQLPDDALFTNFFNGHGGNVQAKFTAGRKWPAQGDVMASFSSRGPDPNRAYIKPDITAPGVQILAGMTPTPIDIASGPPGQLFQAIAGTSMSSPHIAGSAALLMDLNPNWRPGQVKSALMTTATNRNVVKEDGGTPADPYDDGSGRVDLNFAGNPGLTFNVGANAYRAGRANPENLNYPSIFVSPMPGLSQVVRVAHSELNVPSSWTITTSSPAGVLILVNTTTLNIPARGNASFQVTIDAKNVPEGTYFGSIDLTRTDAGPGRAAKVHMPVAFERKQAAVSLDKTCDPATLPVGQTTTCTITAGNSTTQPANVNVVDTVPSALQVIPSSVRGGSVAGNTVTFNGRLPGASVSVTSTPGQTPGYFPLANLGVPPQDCQSASCDDVGLIFTKANNPGLSFTYGGKTYDQVMVTSNGYVTVGSDTTVAYINQRFPDPTPPNNVIAPYWTDLDLDGSSPTDAGGGQMYAAFVQDRVSGTQWFVAEWANAQEFGASTTSHNFQVWITLGSGPAYLEYGPNTATAPALTVGAENANGTAGDNYYVQTRSDTNPTGTPPAEGTELTVNSIVGTHQISFRARAVTAGTYVNTAQMTSNAFPGVSYASATVNVTP